MSRLAVEHVLVIAGHDLGQAAAQLLPTGRISEVADWFTALHFLAQNRVTTVLAAAEPIERRPESAVRTLRQLAGDARVVLFGDPTLEPLSRKMLQFGCDDYFVTPPTAAELGQILRTSRMRIAAGQPRALAPSATEGGLAGSAAPATPAQQLEDALPLAEAMLDALLEAPQDPLELAVAKVSHLGAEAALSFTAPQTPAPAAPAGHVVVSHAVRGEETDAGQLHLILPESTDANSARHLLARLAGLMARLKQLQGRHAALQKLAITDELTGLYNARYFRHFLGRILDLARTRRFPVTLFIFDIDNFKHYNDRFGHGAGDEILKQTAQMMKRACREHDLVARIGGDEFAVVFWEKEGPRIPRDPHPAPDGATTPVAHKPPDTPMEILGRFRRQLAVADLPCLGPAGKGVLTISGGIAVFPYDAWTVEQLIAAADAQLMQRAKKAGKNSIYLVGSEEMIKDEG